MQVLWGALFVLAVLVRDAETAADASAIDAIASTGMLYVLQRIMAEYEVWIADGPRLVFLLVKLTMAAASMQSINICCQHASTAIAVQTHSGALCLIQ